MRGFGDWLVLAALVLDAVLLAVVELVYLPLRFDGVLLPDLGGFPFPVTVLLAAVSTPLLVLAAARLSPKLPVAAAPGFAWLLITLWLMLGGPGGGFGVYPDWRVLVLLGAGSLPSAVVLGGVLGRAQRAAGFRG
ncbi:hypothetical protein GCM10010174_22250 [Kutzneria viridogrisea]|uniref:Uncharacterized protein n=1 Tax=Kutzneria viridogrisea TaxID=47990 RepID=A0ABR6BSS4_9PSEU|nr:hypothetical protein [Kutzneria viridogrisea]